MNLLRRTAMVLKFLLVTIIDLIFGKKPPKPSKNISTVAEPYRRRGIGSKLMQKADEFAQSVNLDLLFVETRPDNIPALGLFNKCGYKIFESGSDNVKLEKRLTLRTNQ